jgi:hypothetical protein
VAQKKSWGALAASWLRLPSSRPGDPIKNIGDHLRALPLIKGKLGKSCVRHWSWAHTSLTASPGIRRAVSALD